MSEEEIVVTELKVEKRRVDAADTRSFWTMVVLAAQNAFNDKAAQFFLIPLAGWLVMTSASADGGGSGLPYILGSLIVVPFIFLSPVAGWLSDRFSKTYILRGAMVMQLVVLALVASSVIMQSLNLGIFGFFLLAVQSSLFSPAKKGLVKEMMGSERLGFASGVLEMAGVLAICAGQILSGFWFDSRLQESNDGWVAAMWPLIIIAVAAVPAALLAWSVKVYPSPSQRSFKLPILWEHIGQLRELFHDQRLKWSSLGIAFFWFFGGFLNLVAIKLGEELTGGAEGFGTEMAWFIAAASGGVILGGVIGSLSCRRHIELGLVPFGGLVMFLGCVMMSVTATDSLSFKAWMMVAGAGGALFLVPLNAYLQDVCAPERRGQVLAGLNLLDCLAGVLAVLAQFGLNALGVDFKWQFLILAVLCLVVTGFCTKLLPQHFVRFTILTFLRIFYRQKVLHAGRLPAEGGVLIVPNHVTYLDAFILTASSKRPIRFLMYDSYFKKAGLVRFFIKFFDTVPISDKRAKDAIQKAADAVAEGGVVCIFPEGQLTRSGCMNELKRGFEMIARKAKCPVVPVYMDGLWGSIFSFERGKFIYKWPYRLKYGVTVAWGEPMHPREATAVSVREKLSELSAESFSYRDALQKPMKSACGGSVKIKEGNRAIVEKLTSEVAQMSEEKIQGLVYNALQISELHALRKKDTIALHVRELGDAAHVLAVILPRIGRYKVVLIDDDTTVAELKSWHKKHDLKNYFGGEKLRNLLDSADLTEVPIYLVNGDQASERCYPVKVVGERVVAMSMPHPIAVTATNQFQAGWKESAYGRVLPGYRVDEDGEQDIIYDPQNNTAITHAPVDKDGFMLLG